MVLPGQRSLRLREPLSRLLFLVVLITGCRGQAPLPESGAPLAGSSVPSGLGAGYDDDLMVASADFQLRGDDAADTLAAALGPYCQAGDWLACGAP